MGAALLNTSPQWRQRIAATIERIMPRGRTNLAAGWLTACELLLARQLDPMALNDMGYEREHPICASLARPSAEALETARCFEEGVLTSAAAANIGSIMGIGFPPATGGAAQFMTGYQSASGEIGLPAFVARADELAAAYGDRFRPTDRLREMAASGESFPA